MKVRLLLIMVGVICITLFSCGKNEIYSCDKIINKWAETNISNIRSMSSSEFREIRYGYQRAAYRVFTPEQRKNLWVSKFENTLSLDWSDAEREHIKLLQSIMNKYLSIFTGTYTETEKNELLIEAYKWVSDAKEILKWDNKLISSIAGNPNYLSNKAGTLSLSGNRKFIDNVKTKTETGGERPKCECNIYESGAIISDCDNSKGGCFGSNQCEKTSLGCGLFWGDPCNGECY